MHRLWETLADKQRPPNGYGAKFSTPYCIDAGFVRKVRHLRSRVTNG